MNSYWKGLTSRERHRRLKEALREQIASREAAALLGKLERCRNDWKDDRFTCRSPACPSCKRRNMRGQQRVVRAAFEGAANSEMVFASICLPACRDIADLQATILKGQQDLSNRIKAAGLDGITAKGFHEVDAVSEQQFWLVPPERKAFLDRIGAVGLGQERQTWLPGMHVIFHRGEHDVADIRAALATQWPILGQVDVQAFKEGRTLEQNLDRITSYSTKFSSLTALRTDTRTSYLDGWPTSWDVELHSYLNSLSKRTPFEFMRFSKGFNEPRVERASDSLREVEPLPFACTFTEIPMYTNTGWSRAAV